MPQRQRAIVLRRRGGTVPSGPMIAGRPVFDPTAPLWALPWLAERD
jgi:hypothetical protein